MSLANKLPKTAFTLNQTNNMPTKPVIFLAFANDKEDNARYLRNLPLEHDGIRTALQEAEKQGFCEIIERANASIKQIFDVFQDSRYRDRIAIFHYGGHADGYQLLLEDLTAGSNSIAHSEGLVSFFAKQKNLQLVFFNGCCTEQQAEELAQAGIPAVIGTNNVIDDTVATDLAIRFYMGIGQQIPLQQAWQAAIDEIKTKKGSDFRGMFRKEAKEEEKKEQVWKIWIKPKGEKWKLEKIAESTAFSNKVLTKILGNKLKEFLPDMNDFLTSLQQEDWEENLFNLKKAQKIIQENFVSVLGLELRRLFSMSSSSQDTNNEEHITNYIRHCLRTYKFSVQLLCFSLLSHLWECGKRSTLVFNKSAILNQFFNLKRELKLEEWRNLLKELLLIYQSQKLEIPFKEKEFENLDLFLEKNSFFNTTAKTIENLAELSNNEYTAEHCQEVERCLAGILSVFCFWAKYKMISIRDIEYHQFKNENPRYVKSMQILKTGENSQNLILKYDDKPIDSLSVFLQNPDMLINLSPFVLDFNAFIDSENTQICLYEYREKESSLVFFFVDKEEYTKVDYLATLSKKTNNIIKREEEKAIKLDSMLLNFQNAMNLLLGGNFQFQAFKEEAVGDFGNL